MGIVLGRLARVVCAGVVALAAPAVFAAPAHAATTTPLYCNLVTTAEGPGVDLVAALLGIRIPPGTEVGLACSAPAGGQQVNFCGRTVHGAGVLVVGQKPVGGVCP